MHFKLLNLVLITVFYVAQAKKPRSKRQQAIWRVECELGVISDVDCPVDGGWSAWGTWSACQGHCDDVGHRHRARECTNPKPANDGIPCNGQDSQTEVCYITNCSTENFRQLIAGDTERTEALHQLEAIPALMERCLQMECPFEAIEAALASDNTWQINPESLWNSLQCVKHNMGCPVYGGWSTWGPWSACGARCGPGRKWRLRRCDTPPPSAAHLVCMGEPLQAEACEGDQCAVDNRDFAEDSGTWSPWGDWSACSELCGVGVKRRRRSCIEKHIPDAGDTWGTHCRGQHDEIETCENIRCSLDGGWAGWGAWGPCSQTCGSGRRSRTRSCTRPVPAGGGPLCAGPRVELGTCYLTPCEVYTHIVAVLNGEGSLHYNFENKRSTLFHFYIRFLPLSPHGTLVRRGSVHSPNVRLSLQNWHTCVDVNGRAPSCSLPRICSQTAIEPDTWHTALITVTTEAATLRLDDTQTPIKGTFPCDPDLPDDKMNIWIGEKLHGEIQEIILNFIPMKLKVDRDSKRSPTEFIPLSASNIAYEKAGKEEAYLSLESEQYVRLPCFDDQDEWRLELTMKPNTESGTVLFLYDEQTDNWFLVHLQNMRLKLKLSLNDFRSESTSNTDCLPNQWLDVTISKKRDTNSIEASLNAGERLHVVLEKDISRKRRSNHDGNPKTTDISEDNESYDYTSPKNEKSNKYDSSSLLLCNDEFYVGGIPVEIKDKLSTEDLTPFNGVLASLSINSVLQDLHAVSMERFKDDKIQVSSRTASESGSYHETVWGRSNKLNLTCLHARSSRSTYAAHWLYLDFGINNIVKDKTVRSVDDGRVLRLVASADKELRGFYTCRAHVRKRTRNIVTYGVIGKIQHKLTGPDTTTAIAFITTLSLVIISLGWLVLEGINDIRNGFGFFRDRHLTPEEEAEAVCLYIDQHMHLIGSKSDARLAKARARRKAKQLRSRLSFGAQEPQGLLQIQTGEHDSTESFSSEQEEVLPALPDTKRTSSEPLHQVYRCEPSYVSSPRHGSNLSPCGRLSSSSSSTIGPASPRLLCSRLLAVKRLSFPRARLSTQRNAFQRNNVLQTQTNLPTIKSSSFITESPAKKILLRFQELKSDD